MSKKKKKKKVAKKKVGVKTDAFGRRLGTQGALIDTKLSKKGKTVKQLAEETKLPVGRISTHVRDLLGKGFIKKDKQGKYSIK
jgi:DNA-binding MarR family transcriptional regulator